MAIDATTPKQFLPLVVACEESQEDVTLPTLHRVAAWRRRLHLLQRHADAAVGVRAGQARAVLSR